MFLYDFPRDLVFLRALEINSYIFTVGINRLKNIEGEIIDGRAVFGRLSRRVRA